MKVWSIFIAFAIAVQAAGVSIWPVDSLIQVFPDDVAGTHRAADDAWIMAARNGHATVQLAVRSEQRVDAVSVKVSIAAGFETQVRRAGYVPVHSHVPETPASEVIRAAPGLFPDPLFEESTFALEPGRTTPVWITVYVPPDANAGLFTGHAVFRSGTDQIADVPFRIRVVSAIVPRRQTLRVTNWLYASLEQLGFYYDLKDHPERYWEVLGNIGRVLADHHQNVILTPVFDLTDATVTAEGALAYDFSRLDRWVDTFRAAGTAQMIEGGHLLGREHGYSTPLTVPAFVVEEQQARRATLHADDPRAEEFMTSFLPALYAHLKEKDWLDDYAQHVIDEAHGGEVPVYQHYVQMIREQMPGVLTIDAIDHPSAALARSCDIWVPQLGTFDHDLEAIRRHVAQAGQAWFYTCLTPRGRYLNRFIDFPLLKTRLLQWFNFRYGFSGYLHWGGNSWGDDPFTNSQPSIADGNQMVPLPAGDAFITYPWREKNSIYSSIRLEAMRDGIEDYELLHALAERDPAKAQDIAQRAISGMTTYVRDVPTFRKLQFELLMAASTAETSALQ